MCWADLILSICKSLPKFFRVMPSLFFFPFFCLSSPFSPSWHWHPHPASHPRRKQEEWWPCTLRLVTCDGWLQLLPYLMIGATILKIRGKQNKINGPQSLSMLRNQAYPPCWPGASPWSSMSRRRDWRVTAVSKCSSAARCGGKSFFSNITKERGVMAKLNHLENDGSFISSVASLGYSPSAVWLVVRAGEGWSQVCVIHGWVKKVS